MLSEAHDINLSLNFLAEMCPPGGILGFTKGSSACSKIPTNLKPDC